MAEPQVQAPPPPRADTQRTAAAPGRKVWYRNPWIIGGIAAAAALGYLWWRSRGGSGGATASTTSSTTALNAADLSYLQGELNGLANGGQSGGGGGYYGGGGYTVSTTTSTGTKGGGGGSTASTTASTKTGGKGGGSGKPKNPPRAPAGLVTSDVTETTARGTWAVTANASSYRAQLWRGGDILHDTTSSALYRAWSGLKGDTTYKWHVMAINSAGQSGWSGTKTFTTAKHTVHAPTTKKG